MHPVLGYVLAVALFCIGVYGVLVRRNAVLVLMAVELMLAGVNIMFVVGDVAVGSPAHRGQVSALFLIVLAAAEVGIGLSIVLRLYRTRKAMTDPIDIDTVDTADLPSRTAQTKLPPMSSAEGLGS